MSVGDTVGGTQVTQVTQEATGGTCAPTVTSLLRGHGGVTAATRDRAVTHGDTGDTEATGDT